MDDAEKNKQRLQALAVSNKTETKHFSVFTCTQRAGDVLYPMI